MNTGEARNSVKKVAQESSSLNPSALVTLFEIDITDLIKSGQRKVYTNASYTRDGKSILRFHNNIKLVRSSIWFDGEEYYAAPVESSGYEISSKGSPPKPKLSVAIDPEGLPQEASDRVTYLKMAIRDLDDLVGAKVTRIRTFAKYLDSKNFYDTNGDLISNTLLPPKDFDPDPNAQLPKDVFYVDRKASETKNSLELELASPFDTQDLKLPGRTVAEFNCPWAYRGEGCCYEWKQCKNAADSIYLKSDNQHVNTHNDCKSTNHGSGNGAAPPVANHKNERIRELIGVPVNYTANSPPPEWSVGATYNKGDITRINLKGINYYFVSKTNGNVSNPPPNDDYWVADQCSKTIEGCKLRWSPNTNPEVPASALGGPLPFGGFPTSRKAVD